MHGKEQFRSLSFRVRSRATTAALPLAIVLALVVVLTQAQAQTYTVLHSFTGGEDGGNPYAGVTLDRGGNLSGTAYSGGAAGNGTAYKLTHKGSGWTFDPLYGFGSAGVNDGANPSARVIFGPDGSLYGTTSAGGGGVGAGTVFNLKPYPTACITALCSWQETVLYRFSGGSDGANPGLGDLIFDQAGNLYGTTTSGGAYGQGAVFELLPSHGGWTEKVLYSFTGGSDGAQPWAGLIFDNAGNLYGTTFVGGYTGGDCYAGCGTAFELMPSGSGWTENTLYTFQGGNDGGNPFGGLIFDQSGNLYGASWSGGQGGGGTVFELAPSSGSWTYSLIYSLNGGRGPEANLVMDGAGNLYGTTAVDGADGCGSVFMLTSSNGSWTYTSLHDFTCGDDGGFPVSNLIFDASGNLYGTASLGGNGGCADGCGVVWEITFPQFKLPESTAAGILRWGVGRF